MKKYIYKSLILFPLIFCCSCESTTMNRKNYLSNKYTLTNAASITDKKYVETAYFKNIPKKEDFISKFDKQNSYIDFHVKVVDKKAEGYGSYSIISKNNEFLPLEGDFKYYCDFSKTYGTTIQFIDETKPSYFGNSYYRNPNWWVRIEINIPELTEDQIFMEFSFAQANDYPSDFEHYIW